MCTEENEKKKDYLNRYLEAKRGEEVIKEQMEQLEGQYILPSHVNDGMPHGSGKSDLSSFAAQYDRLYHRLLRAYEARVKVHEEIYDAIEKMQSTEAERVLLLYRYVDGKSWEEIAVKMGYTWRHTLRLHGRALHSFQIPKNVI